MAGEDSAAPDLANGQVQMIALCITREANQDLPDALYHATRARLAKLPGSQNALAPLRNMGGT
jgi:hypothetical protein